MAHSDDWPSLSAVEVVRELFLAHREGRIEEMLALVHPDVVWHPLTRPGRSQYVGHEGTLAMVEDLDRQLGEYHIDFDEFTELDDGQVVARGRIVHGSAEDEPGGPRVECFLTLRHGLVIGLDSAGPSDN